MSKNKEKKNYLECVPVRNESIGWKNDDCPKAI